MRNTRLNVAAAIAFFILGVARSGADALAATDPASFDVVGVKLGMTVDQAFSTMKSRESALPGPPTADPVIYYSDCRTGTIRSNSEQERASVANGSTSMKEEVVRLNAFCVKVIEIKTPAVNFDAYFTPGASKVSAQTVVGVSLGQTLPSRDGAVATASAADSYLAQTVGKFGAPTARLPYASRPTAAFPAFGNALWCTDGTPVSVCIKGLLAYNKALITGLPQMPSVSPNPISILAASVKGNFADKANPHALVVLISLPGGGSRVSPPPAPAAAQTPAI